MCVSGKVVDNKCEEPDSCSSIENCSSCLETQFPKKSLRCLICKKNTYGEIKLSSSNLELECKDQGEEYQGCMSVQKGKCMMCETSYYMNQDNKCVKNEDI